MKYYVSVSEILSKVVRVEAENKQEALEKAEAAMGRFDIVFDWDDYVDGSTKYELEEDQEYWKCADEDYPVQHID